MSNELSPQLAFLIEFLDLEAATGVKGAKWERHQLEFLNSSETLTIDVKSRQIGWSWNAAADAVAHSFTIPKSTCIFLSVTQTEANEKIRYAGDIEDALDKQVRLKRIIDNRTEIEYENGSRIISHPCRPPRGKARARVYPDEFAHYPNSEEIYTALVPIITRGGVIRIGSSPLGASGKFWDIFTENSQKYPGFRRRKVPWWSLNALCTDVNTALGDALGMSTFERVQVFGTSRLKLLYENMPLPDFQQEFECDWSDESVAWISWDELKPNQEWDALGTLIYEDVVVTSDAPLQEALDAIDSIAFQIRAGHIAPMMFAGVDIGRRRNTTELVVISEESDELWPTRLLCTMDRIPFRDQKTVLKYALEHLPIELMFIDKNGLGMQLAEELEDEYPSQVEGVQYGNAEKQEWAVTTKIRMQKKQCPIPLTRRLAQQIHSIKKKVTTGARVIFDTEANERHHADMFWAFATAHAASLESVGLEQGWNPVASHRG